MAQVSTQQSEPFSDLSFPAVRDTETSKSHQRSFLTSVAMWCMKHPIRACGILALALLLVPEAPATPDNELSNTDTKVSRKVESFPDFFSGDFRNALNSYVETSPEQNSSSHTQAVETQTTQQNECLQPISRVDNLCGQAAIFNALRQLNIPVDKNQLIHDTNPIGIFSSAGLLGEYASKHARVIHHSDGDLLQLKTSLDSGNAVVVLTNIGGPHWVTLTEVETSATGAITHVHYTDSWDGHEKRLEANEFLAAWKNPLEGGPISLLAKYNSPWLEISLSKKGMEYVTPFENASVDTAGVGINHFVIGTKNFDLVSLVKGSVELTFGAPAFVIAGLGHRIHDPGVRVSNWGDWLSNKNFVGSSPLAATLKACGGALQLLGTTLKLGGDFIGYTGHLACKYPLLLAGFLLLAIRKIALNRAKSTQHPR